MKHRITLLVLLLPAIAVAVFYFTGNNAKPATDAARPDHSKKTAKAARTPAKPEEKPAEVLALEDRIKELDAKLQEGRERLAKTLTPESMREANTWATRGREPSYYGLFATWTDVDAQTAEAAMNLIRERDTKLAEVGSQAIQKGAMQKGSSYATEALRQRQAIAKAAEQKLAPLVGRAHFEELTALEKTWDIRPPGFPTFTGQPRN
ncbi:MAG: hypothetical protein ACAH88_03720 [Roseimicrobium sp.]